MANNATLKANIIQDIKQNGENLITGQLLQQHLLAIVNSLGAEYQYAGIATPAINPGTPDQNVFYIASTAGTYANFGGLVLAGGEIAILKYNGTWYKDLTGAATQESVNQLGQISLNNSFVGQGTTFSLTKIYGLVPGRKYRVILKNTTWSAPSLTPDYNLYAISNWYNGASSDLFRRGFGDTIPPYADITIPANSDYIGVGGRANSGVSVEFNIIDITESTINAKPYPVMLIAAYGSFNANNTTGKIEIPAFTIYSGDNARHDISAQEIPFYWASGYGISVLAIDSSYQTIKLVRQEGLEQGDVILGIVQRYDVGQNVVSRFYGAAPDECFKIDGKTVYASYVDSQDILDKGYSLNNYFVGAGTSFALTYIKGLVSGRTYRLIFKDTEWAHPSVPGSGLMAVANWYNETSSDLVRAEMGQQVRPFYDITIPSNSDYISVGGRANAGIKVLFNIYDITDMSPLPVGQEIPKTKVTNGCGHQGLTIVGDTIIQFNPAADDNSTYANLYRWNKTDFSALANMTHNLGHAATIDYNAESDALVVGNGTWDNSVKPRLDIVTNASAKIAAGGALDYTDTDVLHIELATAVKEIGGSGLICTFGGNWRIVYLSTGQNAPQKIFKCILGVGSEDFSDQSAGQDDVTKWGTFISGKSDSEYNGTLKVLSTYTGAAIKTNQGLCYRNGFLYFLCGDTEAYIHKIQLFANGRYEVIQTCLPVDFDADGDITEVEPEGLCFYDKDTMLLGLPIYGGLYKIEAF